MVTTKIFIKPHLKEYVCGKFNRCIDGPITLPHKSDLYHFIWDWTRKRPITQPFDTGNLEIVLPNRRVGKKPEIYNYIPADGVRDIQRKIENLMFAELHAFVDEQKHRKGINIKTSVFDFMERYGIDSISSDALIKNIQRWRHRIHHTRTDKIFL